MKSHLLFGFLLLACTLSGIAQSSLPEPPCTVSQTAINRLTISPDDRYVLVEQKNGKVLLFEIETGKLVESSERISANMDSKMNTQNSILRSLQLNGPNEQFMLRRTDNQVEVVDVSGKVYTRYELTGTEFNLHLIPGTKTILTTITEKKLFKEVDYIVLATPEKGTIRIREVEKGSKEPLLNSGELQIGYLTPDKKYILTRSGYSMRLSDGLIRRINYNRGLPPDLSLLQYHPQKEALQFIDPWEHHLVQIPADGSPAIVSPKPYEGFWDKGRQSKVVPLLNKDGYLHLGYNMYTEYAGGKKYSDYSNYLLGMSFIRNGQVVSTFCNPNAAAERAAVKNKEYEDRMAQIQYQKDKAARLEKERAWWAEYYRKNPQPVSRMCGTCRGNRLISKENPNRNSATERYVYRKEFDGSYTYQGKSYESILVVCPECKGEGWIKEYPDKAR